MDSEEEMYDVVISGISGKFPSSNDLEELKENLLKKVNLVNDEHCRWDKKEWQVPSAIGQINVLKKFDDTFFGIYSGVAGMMDPLTRVAIERAYEAIMDAGINPKNIRGHNVAVYTNSCISDSEAVGCDEKLTAKFWLLAHVRALLANRISYVLHLMGPSWTVDSTWVGGIECLKQAVHDIKVGRVESALVGVSNVIVFPDLSQHWLGLKKLSPDGACRSFEENANGYGRSEGVVFLFLQRANEANRIYATVSHVDVTFCGEKANTLLKPKEEALVDFLQKFYSDYPICLDDLGYLEADGSADKYLDEIELNSIGKVICERRKQTLPIGTVKTNLGHTEGAASLVSIAKALIALNSNIIPPNLDFQNVNKNIKKLQTNEMKIITDKVSFPKGKFAAVNTIGLCTSIGHVLLKPNPKDKNPMLDERQQIPRLVLVSARHEAGILNIIDKLESMPYDAEYYAMVNNVFRESMNGHFYRGFTILGATEKKIHFTLESGNVSRRPVWFVFAGMGSQWPGMGADLMHLPVFANTMKELDTYMKPLGIDIIDVITNFDPTILKNVVNSFVGIAAIQIGMVDVLKSVGIEPDNMFGHSLGENGCAYADGCFTRYQTIMAAYFRGKASSVTSVKKGLMAAIGLGHDKINNLPDGVQIACHNSPENTTISGLHESVEAYMEEMKKEKIFVRAVNSNGIAYHSKLVQPLAPFVLENIKKMVPNPKKRSSRWISTSVPEREWNSPAAQYSSAEYHVNNFLGTVYFAEACAHIPEDAIVIEISPHGLFQSILKRSSPESCFCIPLGKREISSPLNFLLSSLGKLFVVGLQPDVNAIYPAIEFPVSRGTPSLASLATWNHESDWELNTYRDSSKIKPVEISLRNRDWRFLTGYQICNKIFVPFSIFLTETLHAYETKDSILIFENVNIENYVEVTDNNRVTVYTQVQYGSGNFEIVQDESVVMNGIIRYSQENLSPESSYSENELSDCTAFTRIEIQDIFRQHSMKFAPQFNRINEIVFTNEGCQATIIWDNDLPFLINTIAQVKMFYDLCQTEKGPVLPKSFLKLAIEMERYTTMPSGTTINIIYDKYTNTIKGAGIELIGFVNAYHPKLTDKKQLMLQNLQFIPHDYPQTKSMENFYNICGQIIAETFYTEVDGGKNEKSPVIHVILTNDFNRDDLQIQLLIEMLYRELPQIRINVTTFNGDYFKNGDTNDRNGRYLIAYKNIRTVESALVQLADSVDDIFLLCFDKNTELPTSFVKVIEESFQSRQISLYKKKVSTNERVLKIKPSGDTRWLEDLEEDLHNISTQRSVILQWNSEYIVDVIDIINQISAVVSVHFLRYLVIMDENAPVFDKDLIFYQKQLAKGLTMNVYKNGKWGSVRHSSITDMLFAQSDIKKFVRKVKKIEDIDVKYVSIRKNFKKTHYKFDTDSFEFSGTSTDKRRVMGIANLKNSGTDSANLSFTWPVPKKWSLEEAATIPLAYAKAYYALIVKAKLNRDSDVLVHSGHSILGEACIAIALNLNCKVYTSAETNEQINYIRKRFNNTVHLHIFRTDLAQVEIEILKLTKGRGVDLVINAENEKQVKQSTQCLKKFSTFIQVAENTFKPQMKLGLEIFLNSTTVHSLTNLLSLENEPKIKTEIQSFVQEALECDTMTRPFNRIIYNPIDELRINEALQDNNNSHSIIIDTGLDSNSNDKVFMCNPNKSYLLIGDKTEIWFSVITWLLEHNARKLVFVEESTENEYNQYQKRLSTTIQNYPDLSLMYLPTSSISSEKEATNMIKIINNVAALDITFCFSLDGEQMNNINAGLVRHASGLRQLVCLQCDASKICETRQRSSLPALNVIWDRSIAEKALLIFNIRRMINHCLQINSPLIYIADSSHFTPKFDYSKLARVSEFLPQYSEYEYFVDGFSRVPTFTKIISRSPEYDTRTQLFPIFVVPGIHSRRLEPLFRNLMYPVFCAKMPFERSSVKNTAKLLVQALKKIQPNGPYTIVGESWGGAVAVELTSILEQNQEDRVQLILVEGIPKDMQEKLSALGDFESNDFQENLYELCFKNKTRVAAHTENKLKPVDDETTFLELLLNKLASVQRYTPTKVSINSKVIAVKSTDDHVLNTFIHFEEHYGENLDLQILAEQSHADLIKSKITATVINDNVLFQW